jgi:transmembrane sensor
MIENENFLEDPKFLKWINEPDHEIVDYWDKWKAKNPDRQKELDQARAFYKSLKFRQFPIDEDKKTEDWQKIQMVIESSISKRRISLTVYYKAAAAILFLIASVFLLDSLSKRPAEIDEQGIVYIEKATNFGQKLTIHLTDGTIVKLNSGSKLSYPSAFSDSIREVVLTGEGYFQVSKDVDRPFQVISQSIYTKVLGTEFNVNSYNTDNIEIALVEGIVEVLSKSDGTQEKRRLSPGEKAIWKNNHFNIEKLNETEDLGWKDNILVFNEDNIDTIKRKLERWYGINMTVHQPDKMSQSFVGEFQNENLVNVLEIIGHSLRFEFQINNENVTIKPIQYDR